MPSFDEDRLPRGGSEWLGLKTLLLFGDTLFVGSEDLVYACLLIRLCDAAKNYYIRNYPRRILPLQRKKYVAHP